MFTSRAGAPVRADARAEPVVEIAGLRLDRVQRRAAGLPGSVAVQVIELEPGAIVTLSTNVIVSVSEKCQPATAAVPAAAEAAETSAAATTGPPKPAAAGRRAADAGASTFRRRTGRRTTSRPCPGCACLGAAARAGPPPRRRSRTAARIWSSTACEGRRDLSGLEKSKPSVSVSRCGAVEIDRPQVDREQLAGRVDRIRRAAYEPVRESCFDLRRHGRCSRSADRSSGGHSRRAT